MFGICLLHATGGPCGHPTQWLANCLYWCVPGFVFVSGWYGVSFSIKKFARLYGLAIYSTFIAYFFHKLMDNEFNFLEAIKMFRSFWFLNAYAVLMIIAPALDRLVLMYVNKVLSNGALLGLLSIPYVWCFLGTVPYIRDYVPTFEGMNPYSPVMMAGVYIVARLLKSFDKDIDSLGLSPWMIALISIISVLLMAVGFRAYVSPFCTLLAAVTFSMQGGAC